MIGEALAMLASAGGKALVSAMVTDGWKGTKEQFARLLGRGDLRAANDAVSRLDDSRAVLVGLSGADLERAKVQQETAWRTQLAELLEGYPEAERELRALIAEVQAQVTASAGQVEQHIMGFDEAQQAVQGHGVQNVQFGVRGESGAQR